MFYVCVCIFYENLCFMFVYFVYVNIWIGFVDWLEYIKQLKSTLCVCDLNIYFILFFNSYVSCLKGKSYLAESERSAGCGTQIGKGSDALSPC